MGCSPSTLMSSTNASSWRPQLSGAGTALGANAGGGGGGGEKESSLFFCIKLRRSRPLRRCSQQNGGGDGSGGSGGTVSGINDDPLGHGNMCNQALLNPRK
ncbi:unnamed protein product [Ceratitis capitata]|uniref:(Mediterranean fruit fly) hypothetical protein n=1 Tax=Ceratitis capitata TaxID=7213 RepID=A0A811VMH9_CERCA|nr:unnamed protein product [Ceratitis capitata]